MSRHLLILNTAEDRARARRYIAQAPAGTRVELKATKRSLPQNDLFWSLLTDVAAQVEHCGRKFPPDSWKALFMHAWGREMAAIPALDGKEFIPLYRSSDLSKEEMSELIDFVTGWAVENGVKLRGDQEAA